MRGAVERDLASPGASATNFAEGSTPGTFFGDMFMWRHDPEFRAVALDPPAAGTAARRMAKAADEMSHWAEYDYTIINRDIATRLIQLKSILTAERLKRERQFGLSAFVKALCEGR